jgi:gas vesicle protein
MSKSKNLETLIGGMAIGSALGTIIGLLTAPRTGRDSRKMIKKTTIKLSHNLQQKVGHLSEETLNNWEETLTRLKIAIAAGIEASQIKDSESAPTHKIDQ